MSRQLASVMTSVLSHLNSAAATYARTKGKLQLPAETIKEFENRLIAVAEAAETLRKGLLAQEEGANNA